MPPDVHATHLLHGPYGIHGVPSIFAGARKTQNAAVDMPELVMQVPSRNASMTLISVIGTA
jgi:hypothetical protein